MNSVNPQKVNSKTPTPKFITIKLLKKKKKNPKDMDKEKKNLKSNHRKTTNYFKGKTTLMTADFSLKIIAVRKILNRC